MVVLRIILEDLWLFLVVESPDEFVEFEILAPLLAIHEPMIVQPHSPYLRVFAAYICFDSWTLNFLARRNLSCALSEGSSSVGVSSLHESYHGKSIQPLGVASLFQLGSQLKYLSILLGGCVARVPTFDLGACCRVIKVIILGVGFDLIIGHA